MDEKVTAMYQSEHKDRLFKFIFGRNTEESKRWRLQLYNALNDTHYTDPDALKINTIENVIYITMHNDISFLVANEMNLFEEQSTWNPNMPLRGYLYFAILYQKYLEDNEKNIISEQLIKIPNPKFYVFYHGKQKNEDTWQLHLSDAFYEEDKTGNFEWTATVINLHPDHNNLLNKNCTPLYHYVKFVSKIAENKKSGMDKYEAIEKAIDEAIAENLLEGFFKRNRAEVIGMILTEYDEASCIKTWQNDGYTKGLNEGRSEKALETAENLLRMNVLTIEQIANATTLPIEKLEEIQKEIVR